jgi:uncharacterized protein YjbI with pentapeptide repeats
MTTLFICWSGDRSRAAAGVLSRRLPVIVPDLRCLVSTDIEAGRQWSTALQQQLEAADVGLVCLTPEAVGSPWIHYEAGLLAARVAKARDEPMMFTYLLGVDPSELGGPLSGYQGATSTREGTERLVDSLRRFTGGKSAVDFEAWWGEVSRELDAIPPVPSEDVLRDLLKLFKRKTFEEPIPHCSNQQWLGRRDAAREVFARLDRERSRVRAACRPAEADVYDELCRLVDGYAMDLEAAFLKVERLDSNRESGLLEMTGSALAAERRRAETMTRVAQLVDSERVPLMEEAVRFDRPKTTFEERNNLIHRKTAEIEARRSVVARTPAQAGVISGVNLLRQGPAAWNAHRADVADDLSHLQIRNADLRGADLRGIDFDGTEIVNVDLSGANLAGARLNGVVMEKVRLDGATLVGAECKGTDLERVSLRAARLDDLEGFQLKVKRSDLTATSFRGARLRASHIYNSDLSGADLQGLDARDVALKRVVASTRLLDELRRMDCLVELPNEPRRDDLVDWDAAAVPDRGLGDPVIVHDGRAFWFTVDRWDFFISHATTDKESFARPLARALEAQGQRVWLDAGEVKANDRLDDVIAYAAGAANFGVAILSPRFLGREWTERELELLDSDRLFLVLHDGFTLDELQRLRPSLRSKVILTSEPGPAAVARQLVDAVSRPPGQM